MKKTILFLSAFVLFSFFSCTGVKSTTAGMESTAYLSFISPSNSYKDGLEVSLDNETNFSAKTHKSNKRPKGTIYKIAPGKHLISVSYHGDVVYRKTIFVSTQETKKIILE